MTKRLILIGAVALGLAGCGGTSTSGSGGDGASVVPASAALWASVDTDLSSSQWKTAEGLLNKFPSKDQLLAKLRQSFESSTKVSWQNDVKPALGNELDVVLLNLNGSGNVVGLTQPKDEGKFKALLKKLDASDPTSPPTVSEDVNGWTVFADSTKKIDMFKSAASGTKLADDKAFQAAFNGLPGDALAKLYVNGPAVAQKLQQVLQGAGAGASGALAALGMLRSGAAEVVAENDGIKLSVVVKTNGGNTGSSSTPALLKVVPAGALAFIDFRGASSAPGNLGAAAGALRRMPQLAPLLQAALKLEPLFAGENALYVLQGAPIPEVTLLATPKNRTSATAAIDKLVASLRPVLGNASVHETQVDGVPVRVIDFGRFSVYYGQAAGRVFVSTSQHVVSELRGGGQKLADDATFKEAESTAGVSGPTSGILYVNLKDSIPVLESFAQLSGTKMPANLDANLRPLRTFLFFGSSKSGEARLTAFLEIK